MALGFFVQSPPVGGRCLAMVLCERGNAVVLVDQESGSLI